MDCKSIRTNCGGCSLACKKAFTMAEVLVTIGIIGVVAAMTLPGVIASHRSKSLEAMFKRRYSELSQLLLVFQEKEEFIYGIHNGPQLIELLVKHIEGAKASPVRYIYKGGVSAQRKYLGYSLPAYKNYSQTTDFNKYKLDDGFIAVNKEFFIYINDDNLLPTNIYVIIDINGLQKPNIFGYDVFAFKLDRANSLRVIGPNIGECSRTSGSDNNGWACSYEAVNDGNYFKNLSW